MHNLYKLTVYTELQVNPKLREQLGKAGEAEEK